MSFAVRLVGGVTLLINPHEVSNVAHLIELADASTRLVALLNYPGF